MSRPAVAHRSSRHAPELEAAVSLPSSSPRPCLSMNCGEKKKKRENHGWKRPSLASWSRYSMLVWEGTVAGIGRVVTVVHDRPLEEMWLSLHAELPGNEEVVSGKGLCSLAEGRWKGRLTRVLRITQRDGGNGQLTQACVALPRDPPVPLKEWERPSERACVWRPQLRCHSSIPPMQALSSLRPAPRTTLMSSRPLSVWWT